MKMAIMTVLLAVAFGASADSYLYWLVDEDASYGDIAAPAKISIGAYKTADLGSGAQAAGYLNLYSAGGDLAPLGTKVAFDKTDPVAMFASLGSFGDAYTFYIELYSDSDAFVGRSTDGLTYAAAQAYMTEIAGTDAPGSAAWTISSFTSAPVPEPNSAMLVLLGMAFLGLRRRQRKI